MVEPIPAQQLERLQAIADASAVEDQINYTFDLNGDRVPDKVRIDFEVNRYKFTIQYGKMNGQTLTFWQPQVSEVDFSSQRKDYSLLEIDHSKFDPKEQKLERYYIKNPDGSLSHQINQSQLHKDFFPVIIQTLDQNKRRDLLAAYFLLFRSPSFRNDLQAAKNAGVKIQFTQGQGSALFDHDSNTIFIPLEISLRDFLVSFPHELHHQYHHTSPTAFDFSDYADETVQNEADANVFSFKVAKEAGVKIDALWANSYPLYQAYQEKGEEGLKRELFKTVEGFSHLTYLEHAYLNFHGRFGDYEQYAQKRQKVLQDLKIIWDVIIQEFFSHSNAEDLLASSRVQALFNSYPQYEQFFYEERNSLQEVYFIMDGHNKAALAKLKLEVIVVRVRNKALEPVRVEIAQELGITEYY